MRKKTPKKSKSKVCVICKGDKNTRSKEKCCSPDMAAKEKGSWNL